MVTINSRKCREGKAGIVITNEKIKRDNTKVCITKDDRIYIKKNTVWTLLRRRAEFQETQNYKETSNSKPEIRMGRD